MAFEKKLKGGVILIGSLYWQDDLKKNDNIRKEWRDTSLDIEKSILAKLPIRYGRYSNNDIYTIPELPLVTWFCIYDFARFSSIVILIIASMFTYLLDSTLAISPRLTISAL